MTRRWARDRAGDVVPIPKPPPPETPMMTYPLGLRLGTGRQVWARVILPVDLTQREAERLCQMISTLVIPEARP